MPLALELPTLKAAGMIVGGTFFLLSASCGGSFIAEPTPLTKAVNDQDLARVERLLDEGHDPNERGVLFPLEIAAGSGNVEILKLLLARGAVVSRAVDDDRAWSPLFSAASGGPAEAVQVLLDAGADPCVRTKVSSVKGMRPSQVARHRGNAQAVPILDQAERTRCHP